MVDSTGIMGTFERLFEQTDLISYHLMKLESELMAMRSWYSAHKASLDSSSAADRAPAAEADLGS